MLFSLDICGGDGGMHCSFCSWVLESHLKSCIQGVRLNIGWNSGIVLILRHDYQILNDQIKIVFSKGHFNIFSCPFEKRFSLKYIIPSINRKNLCKTIVSLNDFS